MQGYSHINAHAVGFSHVKNNMGCEDYSLALDNGDCCVIAVSDGHGDKSCFRSADGAKLACGCATAALTEFAAAGMPQHDSIDALKERIIADWKTAVQNDIAQRPFTEEETALAGAAPSKPERAYGCTLIAALITSAYFLALQIGDGTLIAAYDGGLYIEPLPADENCVGNVSSSLCGSNAHSSFRHFLSPALPAAVMAVTDGVQESFDEEKLHKFMYSLHYKMAGAGAQNARLELKDVLPQISGGGSADDVSLSMFAADGVTPSPPKPTPGQINGKLLALTNYADALQAELNALNTEIPQNERRRDSLQTEIEDAKKSLIEKRLKFEDLEAELAAQRAKAEETGFKLENALQNRRSVKELLDAANAYWGAKLKELGIDIKPE